MRSPAAAARTRPGQRPAAAAAAPAPTPAAAAGGGGARTHASGSGAARTPGPAAGGGGGGGARVRPRQRPAAAAPGWLEATLPGRLGEVLEQVDGRHAKDCDLPSKNRVWLRLTGSCAMSADISKPREHEGLHDALLSSSNEDDDPAAEPFPGRRGR